MGKLRHCLKLGEIYLGPQEPGVRWLREMLNVAAPYTEEGLNVKNILAEFGRRAMPLKELEMLHYAETVKGEFHTYRPRL